MRPMIVASVVVPTLNSGETIERCLASIKANVTEYKYEIIVVDAGSSDSTLEIARKYADRVLAGSANRINRNKGVLAARGDIICFTDSDCTVPPDWIDKLVSGLIKLNAGDASVAGVGGGNIAQLENASPVEQAIATTMRSPLVSFKARNVAIYRDERPVLHNPPINSALFRQAIIVAGGFREKPGYPEDLDLDIRLNGKGFKLFYLPAPLVQHRHKTDADKFARQMRDFGRKRARVNRQHPGARRLFHYGPMLMFIMLYSPLFFVPLAVALGNALYVSAREKSPRLLGPVFRFSLSFHRNYGAGEAAVIFGRSSR